MKSWKVVAEWRVDRVIPAEVGEPPLVVPLAWFVNREDAMVFCRAQEPGQHVRLIKET